MQALYSENFIDALGEAPLPIQKAFYKQLHFLLQNIRHPSLRAKKYSEAQNIWQARVTGAWRFYFKIENDTYFLLEIKTHPK